MIDKNTIFDVSSAISARNLPLESIINQVLINDLNEHIAVCRTVESLNANVGHAISACIATINKGGKIIFCGNGGSAADSQHLAAELVGRFIRDRRPLPGLALSTDTSVITCIGNDYSFSEVFSRQVIALGAAGDCLIAISTSGNSLNVYNAIIAAQDKGITTIGIVGHQGGKIATLCQIPIIVDSSVTARIQEMHILIGHSICRGIEIGLGI